MFMYFYGSRSGVGGPHICDCPGLHLTSLRLRVLVQSGHLHCELVNVLSPVAILIFRNVFFLFCNRQ
jgi:hypothetical protein